MKLVLASGSPRRLELLCLLAPEFSVLASPVEEVGHTPGEEEPLLQPVQLPAPFAVPPDADPRLWAWRKAVDVARRQLCALNTSVLVLAADTVVVAPGKLLQKPRNPDEAIEMLLLLKGREHVVVTGYALLQVSAGAIQPVHIEAVVSRVLMRPNSLEELRRYVATGEPADKAGAYAVQGLGGRLVEQVLGCWTNVVGLPLCQVRMALSEVGLKLLEYPHSGYCGYCSSISKG